jgi:hypothetical protein
VDIPTSQPLAAVSVGSNGDDDDDDDDNNNNELLLRWNYSPMANYRHSRGIQVKRTK